MRSLRRGSLEFFQRILVAHRQADVEVVFEHAEVARQAVERALLVVELEPHGAAVLGRRFRDLCDCGPKLGR